MEQRKHPRFSVRVPTAFSGYHEGMAWLADLSKTGGRLQRVDDLAEENDVLAMRLYFTHSMPPIRIEAAVVRWKTDTEMGVEFFIMDSHQEQRLHQYLAELPAPVQS
jgi:hypothetical protein